MGRTLNPSRPPGVVRYGAIVPASGPSVDSLPADRPPRGRVWFVGAGPGSPDLLTLRAVECLRQADVVVHDALVPVRLLEQVAAGRLVPAPRGAGGDMPPGDDPGTAIGRLLVRLASTGQRVVRLKGGDPTVFARLAEELAPVQQAGLDWEIVPGVTAALAAAAAAGLPLTSRAAASSLTLVTGHGAAANHDRIDYAALSRLPGTLAVYMGVEQVRTWAGALLAAGRSATTPVTVVSRCGWPDQRIMPSNLGRCAAGDVGDDCAAPAIVLVGAGADAGASPGFAPGRLAGTTVLVTRPAGQTAELAEAVAAQGGIPVSLPLIEIGPAPDPTALDAAIRAADRHDWIVFASVNGVAAFVSRLRALGRDGRALGSARLAAIGTATRRALEAAGFVCDAAPDEHDQRSEGLLQTLSPTVRGGRFLLVRADGGREVLPEGLRADGHHVEEVAAYTSRPRAALPAGDLDRLDAIGIDWVTITSGRIAEAACRLLGDRLSRWRVASISPVTSAVLRRHGIEPAAEAPTPTVAGIIAAIVTAVTDRGD
jgi:uroporphyrinogen III methyltransferase/synthase